MRMVDLIMKKKRGEALSADEIAFFIRGYVSGEIPDYQVSAMTMAICFSGMDADETAALTMEMARSGDMADLSDITGIKTDKHSTGGVGDKTTLIVAPIVASLGVPVAKMSGRGLGHTGGTIDKLESIPGYRAGLSNEEFISNVKKIGISIAGQTGNLAPADKMLYALRDVTATVDSIPLIASSIMSKKIAAGADAIVLDVKTGSGAFMKNFDDARALAWEMVSIGKKTGRRTIALITGMDSPLGNNIGNSLEVIEAVETLSGHGPENLTALCVELAAEMLSLAGKGDIENCRKLALNAINDGSALRKFKELITAQGGDVSYIDDTSKLPLAKIRMDYKAASDGYILHIDAEKAGITSMLLGAGRKDKNSPLDYGAGIILRKKTGDAVRLGDVIAELYTSADDTYPMEYFGKAVEIGDTKPTESDKVILARIDSNKLHI